MPQTAQRRRSQSKQARRLAQAAAKVNQVAEKAVKVLEKEKKLDGALVRATGAGVAQKRWVHPELTEAQKRALPTPRMLITRHEKWLLAVLNHIYDPLRLFNPPGLDFTGLPGGSMICSTIRGNDLPPGGLIVTPLYNATIGSPGKAIVVPGSYPGWDYPRYRAVNYIQTAGQVRSTYDMVGDTGMVIAINPYDFYYPVSINRGPSDKPFWVGALHAGVGPYPTTATGGVSDALRWSSSPFIIPTDYACPYYPNMDWRMKYDSADANVMFPISTPYPPLFGSPIPDLHKVYSVDYLAYCMRLRVTVSINRTAYTSTTIRVRTAESYLDGEVVDRVRNRIDDPTKLEYGFYQTPISSTYAEATYTSSRWTQTGSHTTATVVNNAQFAPPPYSATPGPADAFAIANWNNVQTALGNNFPVFELRQVTSDPGATSEVTITIDADYALTPMFYNTGVGPHSPETEQDELPPWFTHYTLVGGVVPDKQQGVRPAIKRAELATKALTHVVGTAPGLKQLALSAPPSHNKSAWDRFMDGISSVGDFVQKASRVVSPILQMGSRVVPMIANSIGGGTGPIVEEVGEGIAGLLL